MPRRTHWHGVTIDDTTYVHETAYLYGKISIGAGSSVWPQVVMRKRDPRGEDRRTIEHPGLRDGPRRGVHPDLVGDDCSITHHSTIHGCTIGDRCLIGINATIMDGAVIGENSIVAGHSIVRRSRVSPNSIIAGVPAKVVGTRDNGKANAMNAEFYRQNAINYVAGEERMSDDQMRAIFRPPTEPNRRQTLTPERTFLAPVGDGVRSTRR